jgi:hypothetical protein
MMTFDEHVLIVVSSQSIQNQAKAALFQYAEGASWANANETTVGRIALPASGTCNVVRSSCGKE